MTPFFTLLYLIIWLVSGTPSIGFVPNWNAWGVGLIFCVGFDLYALYRRR